MAAELLPLVAVRVERLPALCCRMKITKQTAVTKSCMSSTQAAQAAIEEFWAKYAAAAYGG